MRALSTLTSEQREMLAQGRSATLSGKSVEKSQQKE